MDIKYIAILVCSNNGESFKNVESASVSIMSENKTMAEISIY